MIGKAVSSAATAVAAAFGSALCCAGPLLAVTLGVSGAGFATTFEPMRPYLLTGAAVLLGFGFYTLDREEKKACEPGKACANQTVRRRMKVTLWIATALAVFFATYPTWSAWIL